jgi:hypothetical protein
MCLMSNVMCAVKRSSTGRSRIKTFCGILGQGTNCQASRDPVLCTMSSKQPLLCANRQRQQQQRDPHDTTADELLGEVSSAGPHKTTTEGMLGELFSMWPVLGCYKQELIAWVKIPLP